MTAVLFPPGYTLQGTLELLDKCGFTLPSDTTADNIVDRLCTALIALENRSDTREDSLAYRKRHAHEHGVTMSADSTPSPKSQKLRLNLSSEDVQRIERGKRDPVPEILRLTEAEFAKLPISAYEYSAEEQHLVMQWHLFRMGLRASPPAQPRPKPKPVVRIIPDPPPPKISDEQARKNADEFLMRTSKPRWAWDK